jgi:hypothetical protein
MKKTNGNKQNQVMIRMSDALKERIEKYQMQFEKKSDLEMSFATAARSLLEKGLDAVGL